MTTKREKSTITDLTPDAARILIAHNVLNRPLRAKRIKRLANAITQHRWVFNGASIVIDTKGRMMDGQHRCHAVIRANKPIRTVLVTGVSPKAFNTIDQGAKRSGTDIFSLCGVSNPGIVSSSLSFIHQNKQGYIEGSSDRLPDMDERTALFDSMPGYEEIVRDVCRYRESLKGTIALSMMCALHYLFREKGKIEAQRFLVVFATPNPGSDKNPAHVARRMFKELSNKDYRVGRQSQFAYMKLAWNSFSAGERIISIELPDTLDIPINAVSSRYWLEND